MHEEQGGLNLGPSSQPVCLGLELSNGREENLWKIAWWHSAT